MLVTAGYCGPAPIDAGWPGNLMRCPVSVSVVPSTLRTDISPSRKIPDMEVLPVGVESNGRTAVPRCRSRPRDPADLAIGEVASALAASSHQAPETPTKQDPRSAPDGGCCSSIPPSRPDDLMVMILRRMSGGNLDLRGLPALPIAATWGVLNAPAEAYGYSLSHAERRIVNIV